MQLFASGICLSLLLLLLPEGTRSHDHTICAKLSDTVVHECSAQYPVCCVWPNGLFIACCPAGSTCDLFRGQCVHNSQTTTGGNGDEDTKSIPSKSASSSDESAPVYDTTQPSGIEISLQTAASLFGVMFVGLLLATNFCTRLGRDIAFIQISNETLHALEEREILVAEGDSSDGDDEELTQGTVNPTVLSGEESDRNQPVHMERTDSATEDASEADDVQLLPTQQQQQQEGTRMRTTVPVAAEAVAAQQPSEEEEEESLLCKICYSRVANSVLSPCGHVMCCTKCAKKLATCPMCRESVVSIIKLANAKNILLALEPSSNAQEGRASNDGPVQAPNSSGSVPDPSSAAAAPQNRNDDDTVPSNAIVTRADA